MALSEEHLERSKEANYSGELMEALHEFRKSTDALIQWAAALKPDPRTEAPAEYLEKQKKMVREMSIVYTKLQEAKMWLGKCLEAVGSPFPQELRDEANLSRGKEE